MIELDSLSERELDLLYEEQRAEFWAGPGKYKMPVKLILAISSVPPPATQALNMNLAAQMLKNRWHGITKFGRRITYVRMMS